MISDHDESGSGHEELYVVLDGHATFEIDGETVEAPAGTSLSVAPEARPKATGAGTVLVVGGTRGAPYQAFEWCDAWTFHNTSITAYGELFAPVRDQARTDSDFDAVRGDPRFGEALR